MRAVTVATQIAGQGEGVKANGKREKELSEVDLWQKSWAMRQVIEFATCGWWAC